MCFEDASDAKFWIEPTPRNPNTISSKSAGGASAGGSFAGGAKKRKASGPLQGERQRPAKTKRTLIGGARAAAAAASRNYDDDDASDDDASDEAEGPKGISNGVGNASGAAAAGSASVAGSGGAAASSASASMIIDQIAQVKKNLGQLQRQFGKHADITKKNENAMLAFVQQMNYQLNKLIEQSEMPYGKLGSNERVATPNGPAAASAGGNEEK